MGLGWGEGPGSTPAEFKLPVRDISFLLRLAVVFLLSSHPSSSETEKIRPWGKHHFSGTFKRLYYRI